MVSKGCESCYAMKTAHRFSKPGMAYEGLTEMGPHGPRWTGKIKLVSEALEEPLHWKTPRRIFVNSMSDLFHEDVPDEFIDQVFITMGDSPRHTFQILTKRPKRMEDYIARSEIAGESFSKWPLPNVWLGASIEDQATASDRIPSLLATPAAVRFLSVEPLLGFIDLSIWFSIKRFGREDRERFIDWVIVGGESGPGARPCDVQWIRVITAQCMAAGVPVFVKQLGANIAPITIEAGSVKERLFLKDPKGGDMAEWPEDLRVREFPR